MTSYYSVEAANYRYGPAEVLKPVSLTFNAGEFWAILGPNGAGKSTLLSLLAGLRAPSSGACLFLNRPAFGWPRRNFARLVAVVQQTEPPAFPFTAEEVVYMGRMPHRTGLYESASDHAAVTRALETTGMSAFRKREFRTLSGGEKQRILLASALAQEPKVLLLDEPSTHLDLQHQVQLHRLLRELSRSGLLVVAVTHDLNLAAAYADRFLLLENGALRASGKSAEVLQKSLIEEVFHVSVQLHHAPSGHPWILYGD